jgi:hypothetical protein
VSKQSLIPFSCMVAILSIPLSSQGQERCGVAKDLMFQALERVRVGSNSEVEDGVQLLKHANEMCRGLGDAWYYRSLFERKLNKTAIADYSRSNAKKYGSEAMDEGADPFVLAAPPQPGLKTLPPTRNKWALVVGISKFSDADLNLNFTDKDAKDLSAVLVDPSYGRFPSPNVHTVTETVTTKKLKEELNWLARMAGPDDLVLVFLATHGTSRSQDTADVNYVVTSDTDLKDQDSLFGTSVGMVELSDVVRTRIRARRTVILLDTCHSGGAAIANRERALEVSESSPSASLLDRIGQGVGRAIVSSSQENQSSYEGAPYQNGYFTHFLVEAFRKDNGMDTVQQMFAYMKDEVSKAAIARLKSSPTLGRGVNVPSSNKPAAYLGQTPVLTTSEIGGSIVLGVPISAGSSGRLRSDTWVSLSSSEPSLTLRRSGTP